MISLNLKQPETRSFVANSMPLSRGWDIFSWAGSTDANIEVNPFTAMGSETVNSCVRLISSSIASLPMLTYARVGNSKTQLFDNEIYQLLRFEPNPESTPQTLFESLVRDILLWGNGFLEIVRKGGKVTGLWYVPASQVRVYRNDKEDLLYDINLAGATKRTLQASSIIHVAGHPSGDGVTGVSVITTARNVIAENLAISRHTNTYFANVSMPSGIIKTTQKLKPEDRVAMRENWESLQKGQSQHRVAIMGDDTTYVPLSPTNNVESDLIKAKEWSRQAVCSLFGVNTALVSSEARQSGETYSAMMISFLEVALKPTMSKVCAELLRKLFPGQMGKFAIEYDWHSLLQSDPQSLMESMSLIRSAGVYTTDELRELAGLNPLGDDVGNLVLAPVNLTNAKNLVNAKPDPKIVPMT